MYELALRPRAGDGSFGTHIAATVMAMLNCEGSRRYHTISEGGSQTHLFIRHAQCLLKAGDSRVADIGLVLETRSLISTAVHECERTVTNKAINKKEQGDNREHEQVHLQPYTSRSHRRVRSPKRMVILR